MKLCLKWNVSLEKKSLSLSPWMLMTAWMFDKWRGTPLQARSYIFHVVSGVSRPRLPIGLRLAQLKSNEQVYLAYYLWKQGLNNWPNFMATCRNQGNDIPNRRKEKGWAYQWQTQNYLTCKPQTHLIIQQVNRSYIWYYKRIMNNILGSKENLP